MTTTPEEAELTERLHRMTERIDGVPPTALAIRRGRSRVRRGRAAGVGATLSVAGVACAVAVTSGMFGQGDGTRVPADASSGAPTPSSAPPTPTTATTPSPTPQCAPVAQADPGQDPDMRGFMREYRPTLTSYRALLVAHLDPQERHLQGVENVQSGTGACGVSELGTKLGWTMPGEDGLGELQVEVSTGWRDSQVHLSHEGWHPAATVPPGAQRALVVEYDGGRAVAVTRADGITVSLDASDLFGNNSTVAVSGMELTVDQLLETAADPGFALP